MLYYIKDIKKKKLVNKLSHNLMEFKNNIIKIFFY